MILKNLVFIFWNELNSKKLLVIMLKKIVLNFSIFKFKTFVEFESLTSNIWIGWFSIKLIFLPMQVERMLLGNNVTNDMFLGFIFAQFLGC